MAPERRRCSKGREVKDLGRKEGKRKIVFAYVHKAVNPNPPSKFVAFRKISDLAKTKNVDVDNGPAISVALISNNSPINRFAYLIQ